MGSIQESMLINTNQNQLNETMEKSEDNPNLALLEMSVDPLNAPKSNFDNQIKPKFDQRADDFLDFDIGSQLKEPNKDNMIDNENILNLTTDNPENLEGVDFLNGDVGIDNEESEISMGEDMSDLSESFISFLGENQKNKFEKRKQEVINNLPQFLNKISIPQNFNFTQSNYLY